MNRILVSIFAISVVVIPLPAMAYIGPGAGITMLGALGGLIITILLAVGGLLIWPIRALLRKRKKQAASSEAEPEVMEESANAAEQNGKANSD